MKGSSPTEAAGGIGDRALVVERRGVEAVPLRERHGRPAGQFALWLRANLTIADFALGFLPVRIRQRGRGRLRLGDGGLSARCRTRASGSVARASRTPSLELERLHPAVRETPSGYGVPSGATRSQQSGQIVVVTRCGGSSACEPAAIHRWPAAS
jgi:hypothetical protein